MYCRVRVNFTPVEHVWKALMYLLKKALHFHFNFPNSSHYSFIHPYLKSRLNFLFIFLMKCQELLQIYYGWRSLLAYSMWGIILKVWNLNSLVYTQMWGNRKDIQMWKSCIIYVGRYLKEELSNVCYVGLFLKRCARIVLF